jgi:hypothetical protein
VSYGGEYKTSKEKRKTKGDKANAPLPFRYVAFSVEFE